MKLFTTSLVALLVLISLDTGVATAGHHRSVYDAADEYRDAVRDFERHVSRLRYVERDDRRLIDRLEDAAGDLRSAARRPSDFDRLACRWDTVLLLHSSVERALLQRPCYPYNPELIQCWSQVDWALKRVAIAIDGCRGGFADPGIGPDFGQGHRDRAGYPPFGGPAVTGHHQADPFSFGGGGRVAPWDNRHRASSVPGPFPFGAPPHDLSMRNRVDPRAAGVALLGALLSRALD